MEGSKSQNKQKITMDNDVFSLFGRQDDKMPIINKEGLRPEGTSNRTRPICDKEEKEALKTIFMNHINFHFLKLPSIPRHETIHLMNVVRDMEDFECSQHKIDELNDYLKDEELSQLLAEAEKAKIDILLTCNSKLLDQRKNIREKGIVKVEIMQPSEFMQKYLY